MISAFNAIVDGLTFCWQDMVDIAIIAVLIYYFLIWTKNYRAKSCSRYSGCTTDHLLSVVLI